MRLTHSEGPWHLAYGVLRDAQDGIVGLVEHWETEDGKANGRLIVRAPNMVRTLLMVEHELDTCGRGFPDIEACLRQVRKTLALVAEDEG